MKNEIPQKFIKMISHILSMKKKGLIVIDTHVHPFDVMGVAHFEDYNISSSINELRYKKCKNLNHGKEQKRGNECEYIKPGILEIFKYGKLANLISPLYFKVFSKSVEKSIELLYKVTGEQRLLKEMRLSCVDRSILLPVEPWVTVNKIGECFQKNNFLLLGSLDIHNIEVDSIPEEIERQITTYNIVGFKLHPNLQNFKPQPSHNPPEIAEKLRTIYETVANHNLYILFHGGISYFQKNIDLRYGNISRDRHNALLENFCDREGKSEIFGEYDIPIVLAHLGHYGRLKIDYDLLQIITRKYKNVFFDTAGMSPNLIRKVIQITTSKKILFGSDALYNKMIYNLFFLYLAIKNAKIEENFEEMLLNILGQNFISKVLKK